jgi:hypothetical protein
VSIADAGGVVVDASGVSTTGRTTGNVTVTINGFPSSLHSATLGAGLGLQVQTTSTLNTYTYHKLIAKEADVKQLSDDINDFQARYRVSDNAPTTDLDEGDLWYDKTANKMKVYDTSTSAWKEVQSVGNFSINTLSSSSATGGGSATFNGSAYRFTLSNAGANAQQMLVSVNGVIQKPNSGTSQPSEGFAIDTNDIIFAAAPASGASQFIVTIGSTVNIGQPSNNTVDTSELVDGAVNNAKVSSSAAIAGTKISPNFGSQNLVTTGKIEVGTVIDLNANGTATFSNRVNAGNNTLDELAVKAFNNSSSSPSLFCQNFNSSGDVFLAANASNTTVARIGVNGSAMFAGSVSIGGTAAVNTIDEYEEGTFTPRYSAGVTSPGYDIQQGYYTKVGNLVSFVIGIRSNSGTANGSQLTIAGLPFTTKSSGSSEGGAFLIYNADIINNSVTPTFYLPVNGNSIQVYTSDGNNSWQGNSGNTVINRVLRIRGQYFTN